MAGRGFTCALALVLLLLSCSLARGEDTHHPPPEALSTAPAASAGAALPTTAPPLSTGDGASTAATTLPASPYEKDYTAVLVVALGRSGSTVTMAGLSQLPSAFIFPEPYYAWRTYLNMGAVLPPSMQALFSCEIFNNSALATKVKLPR